MSHGVYACKVFLDQESGTWLKGALHYGPRPVFQDSLSLEVHVLDEAIDSVPAEITIEIVQRLRDVQNFESPEALKEAIAKDISQTRGILGGL